MFLNTITIAAGAYLIGDESLADSRPVHEVRLDAYALMLACVSNQDFAGFVADGAYHKDSYWSAMGLRWRESKNPRMPAFREDADFNASEQPVVGISWYEALAYAQWLSDRTGLDWRLPTEAEWEVAAACEGEGIIHSAATGLPKTIPVIGAGYQMAHGAWNLLGNVWEWCSTRWGRRWQSLDYPYPYDAADGREDLSGSYARVMRGGSWFDMPQEAHAPKRARYLPGSRASNIGFRLVYSP